MAGNFKNWYNWLIDLTSSLEIFFRHLRCVFLIDFCILLFSCWLHTGYVYKSHIVLVASTWTKFCIFQKVCELTEKPSKWKASVACWFIAPGWCWLHRNLYCCLCSRLLGIITKKDILRHIAQLENEDPASILFNWFPTNFPITAVALWTDFADRCDTATYFRN